MFENIVNFFKKIGKKEDKKQSQESSKNAAKERLHLVLMQDRANVSADFLELMKQEIIDVIKKYIEVDEKEIDVRLTNKENEDGTNGAPALYANIPILNIKNESRKINKKDVEAKKESKEDIKQEKEQVEQENKETENVEKIRKEESNKKKKEKTEKVTTELENEKSEEQNDIKQEDKDKQEEETVKEEVKSEN